MLSIILIGTGNVAQQLYRALENKSGIKLVQVIGRDKKKLTYFTNVPNIATDFGHIMDADIYIIAVNDDAITTVSQYFVNKKGLVLHTSGAMPMSILPPTVRRGVFYPLQTFSQGRKINFSEVPICIEAENNEDFSILKDFAGSISDQIHLMTSNQRKLVHLAAVFVNNFANHLYVIGDEICKEAEVPFTILNPLILETAKKATQINPLSAQTGPAIRNDKITIEQHLGLLKNRNHRDIYTVLSNSIQKSYGNKL